jgi:4,5-DOPA dioxygenase extradiol
MKGQAQDRPQRPPYVACTLSRREVLAGGAGVAIAATTGPLARAATSAGGEGAAIPARPPVVYLGHGSPRLPIDPVRSGELRAWGATLPRVRGIVVMTPHFGSRRLELGPTGPGMGLYNMPGWMKRQLPRDLDYRTPPSAGLATRVEQLLGGVEPVGRSDRRGFDHTTWMPLSYLCPAADAPVLEVSFPYREDAEIFALGRRLAPLRDEGVLFVASGQLTHNLAALSFDASAAEGQAAVPAWSREFDAWGAEVLGRLDVDAVLDWRRKAPAAEIAHPDDGGHFRVLVFALGALVGSGGPRARATFPVQGFESTMSKRGVELA